MQYAIYTRIKSNLRGVGEVFIINRILDHSVLFTAVFILLALSFSPWGNDSNLHALESPIRPKENHYKYDLSICVLFQNEAPYLKEWIEYHKMLGVQHFFCFNHYSTDNYLEVLQPYIDDGTVELKNIMTIADNIRTYYAMQCKCYTDCIRNVRGISKWVAFIDPDEFLLPMREISLVEFLKDYERFGGVAINWRMFGTSNLKKIPEGKLLIESLVMCSESSFVCNRHVKSIVMPECVSHFKSAHQPIYLEQYSGVNTNGFSFEGDKSYQVLWNKLLINHYWTRDEDFFYKVKMGRQIKWGGKPNPEQLFSIMNAARDETILRYVPELKKRMNASPKDRKEKRVLCLSPE